MITKSTYTRVADPDAAGVDEVRKGMWASRESKARGLPPSDDVDLRPVPVVCPDKQAHPIRVVALDVFQLGHSGDDSH